MRKHTYLDIVEAKETSTDGVRPKSREKGRVVIEIGLACWSVK